jgi:sortase A
VTRVRSAVRGLGELLITAGLVALLFIVYQLFWTNLEAGRAQGRVAEGLRDSWERPLRASGEGAAEGSTTNSFKGIGFMYIPRLGEDNSTPIVRGVTLDDLARGVGHYPQTAGPGAVGNFAVAGHRATHGEPFAYLDRVRPGDAVYVETRNSWFTYVVDRTQIVQPTDVWVLDPVPGKPAAVPTDRLLTLTTCNPRWSSAQRLIVFGHLETRQDKDAGPPPELRTRA